jgi:hypothetical protein
LGKKGGAMSRFRTSLGDVVSSVSSVLDRDKKIPARLKKALLHIIVMDILTTGKTVSYFLKKLSM